MTKRKKWIVAVVIVIALGVIAVLSMSNGGLEVETSPVRLQTIEDVVAEEGRTRVREEFSVAAPVAGRLARISLSAGDVVEENDEIARIYPAPTDIRSLEGLRAGIAAAEAKRGHAEADLEAAEVRAAQMDRQAERHLRLFADSVVSRQEYELSVLTAATARQQVHSLQKMVEAAMADVVAARSALIGVSSDGESAAILRAPGSGTILRVLEESERVVSAGTPLVEIGDARGMEVEVDVLTEDAVRIKPGNRAYIEDWGGENSLTGEVRLIEPSAFTKVSALGVEEQRVKVILDIHDPPATLGAGYRLEARIVTWVGSDVLAVPTSAVFQRNGVWTVFVLSDGTAESRSIRTGHRSGELVEVLEGVREGEVVILFPSDQLSEGARVQSTTRD